MDSENHDEGICGTPWDDLVPTYSSVTASGMLAESASRYSVNYPHSALTYRIIRAAIEVHRHLGPGFLEAIYEEALSREFDMQGIPYERQKLVQLYYKGNRIGEHRLDLVVDGCVILELKAVEALGPAHRAQALSYLRATGLEIALLLNFARPTLREGIERVLNTKSNSASSGFSDPQR